MKRSRQPVKASPYAGQVVLFPPGQKVQRGGRGLRKPPGEMNATEAARAVELDAMRARGEILWWAFEGIRFRLAHDQAFYTPDFVLMKADGLLVVEEIKGHWEEAALVRIKACASLYPLRFVALSKRPKKDGGGWSRREFVGWSDPLDKSLAPVPVAGDTSDAADLADELF